MMPVGVWCYVISHVTLSTDVRSSIYSLTGLHIFTHIIVYSLSYINVGIVIV